MKLNLWFPKQKETKSPRAVVKEKNFLALPMRSTEADLEVWQTPAGV